MDRNRLQGRPRAPVKAGAFLFAVFLPSQALRASSPAGGAKLPSSTAKNLAVRKTFLSALPHRPVRRDKRTCACLPPRDCAAEARPADETAEAEQGQRSAFCKRAIARAAKTGHRNRGTAAGRDGEGGRINIHKMTNKNQNILSRLRRGVKKRKQKRKNSKSGLDTGGML